MKHFCDLPTHVARQALRSTWFISEKYDGSYLRAGYDADGRFFTTRKGHRDRYYHVNDWPNLAWTNSFKSAHVALQGFFEFLRVEKLIPKGEHWCDFEVIAGQQPNAIVYSPAMKDQLIITGSSFEVHNVIMEGSPLFNTYGRCETFADAVAGVNNVVTKSGRESHVEVVTTAWEVSHVRANSFNITEYLRVTRSPINILSWFHNYHDVMGYYATNETILNLNLTQQPHFIPDFVWKTSRKTVVAELKLQRAKVRAEYEIICNMLARLTKYQFSGLRGSKFVGYRRASHKNCEGVVVTTMANNALVTFKLVDKEQFAPLNHFAHIVRYWLQGGSRPARPSFMSRTADWPVEKRLARLEVLRKRYIKYRRDLTIKNRFNHLSYAGCEELDTRTLLLFAELKERITNGWSSVQDQDSSDSETGNPAHDQVASNEDGV